MAILCRRIRTTKHQRFFLISATIALLLASSISSAAGPDYFVSASSDPWLATNMVNIVYSAVNLSDIPAPATEIEFRAKVHGEPSRQVLFGRVVLPNLGPWKSTVGRVTYPLPSWISSTMMTMVLISHINPGATVPEKNIANNITTVGFGAIRTTVMTARSLNPVPNIPRPALRVPTLDPTFGSTITRLTDPSMIALDPNHPSKGMVVEYSRFPAVNADGSKALMLVLGGADRGYYYLVDLAGGERRILTRVQPSGDPEFSWHPTDPNRAFYRFGNEVRVLHADTLQIETLMSLPEYGYISAKAEGRLSDDWRSYAFVGHRLNNQGQCCDWSQGDLGVVDLVEKRIVARMALTSIPDWVSMSPSGAYVVVMFVNGQGTKLFRRDDLSEIRTLIPDYSHSDFAIDANGDEVLVYAPSTAAQVLEVGNKTGLASVRLRDGDKKLFLETGWWWASHVSGIGSRVRKGWVLISTYNNVSDAQQPLGREIFWVALDGSGLLKRIAHHHSDLAYTDQPWGREKDYFAEPHATSSWDGKAVFFNSVWGDNFNQYDVYKASGPWWE